MFESSIFNVLISDGVLPGLVSTFNSVPAIFPDMAPEKAVKPYIVFKISSLSPDYQVMKDFIIMVNFFDYTVSLKSSRDAAERIESILDQKILTHERYSDIRVNYFAGSQIEMEDPRDVHYNLQFQARAIRKKWIINHI